jgi:undecaprenyl-diphosphatase
LNYLEALILALMQGLTEFLPISSSGHLIVTPMLFGWEDQGAAFDIAVHLGTLLAVCFYFRDEVSAICRAWLKSVIRREPPDAEARFGWFIGVATIPVGIVGLLWHDEIQMYLRSPMIIAATTLIFGVALWLADRHGGRGKDEHTLTLWAAVLIGCAQAIALIPGTSRSGITITAGLLLGLSRPAAARFSFLMAIPVIALASMNEIRELVEVKSPVEWDVMVLGILVSAFSAYLCIHYFLRMLDKISMLPFAIYRVILAGVIFAVYAMG